MTRKTQAHEIVAEIHRLASELGRPPTRDEWVRLSSIPKDHVSEAFGSFSVALKAAGLERKPEKSRTQRERMTAPLPATKAPEPERVRPSSAPKKILVLGDTHFPWVNVDALCAVYAFAEKNPDIEAIVQVGDLYDLFAWSRFPKTLIYKPDEEIERARSMAEDMWRTLQRILPHAQCHQILGNHDVRASARLAEKAPELDPFFSVRSWYEFQKVQTLHDSREPLELGGVWFIHGFLSRLGDHARKFLRSIVCGHTHRGGVVSIPTGVTGFGGAAAPGAIFELNAGYLGDASSRPMSYTPTKMNEWTLGFAVIDEWGPRFIPLTGE